MRLNADLEGMNHMWEAALTWIAILAVLGVIVKILDFIFFEG